MRLVVDGRLHARDMEASLWAAAWMEGLAGAPSVTLGALVVRGQPVPPGVEPLEVEAPAGDGAAAWWAEQHVLPRLLRSVRADAFVGTHGALPLGPAPWARVLAPWGQLLPASSSSARARMSRAVRAGVVLPVASALVVGSRYAAHMALGHLMERLTPHVVPPPAPPRPTEESVAAALSLAGVKRGAAWAAVPGAGWDWAPVRASADADWVLWGDASDTPAPADVQHQVRHAGRLAPAHWWALVAGSRGAVWVGEGNAHGWWPGWCARMGVPTAAWAHAAPAEHAARGVAWVRHPDQWQDALAAAPRASARGHTVRKHTAGNDTGFAARVVNVCQGGAP
jgi:hypothetical protein